MDIIVIAVAILVAAFVYVALAHVGMLVMRKVLRIPQKRYGPLFGQKLEDHYGGQTPSMEERRALRRQSKRR